MREWERWGKRIDSLRIGERIILEDLRRKGQGIKEKENEKTSNKH